MLALQQAVPQKLSYAQQWNDRYNNTSSDIVDLATRYNDTFNSLPASEQSFIANVLQQSGATFRRNNPTVTSWSAIQLAQSIKMKLSDIYIDTTMQRELVLLWVATLLADFKSVQVVPIQVYFDASGRACAWDGQHTVVLLWYIATRILGLDPEDVEIPVNVYPSSKKSQMRECFLSLNSSVGKKQLDLIDHWMQMIFGVRVDGSTNPDWVEVNEKQKILEKYDLFVTHDKFGNTHLPGAISRLQEINKLDLDTLDNVAYYLSHYNFRPIAEKEMVMMSYFFDRCRLDMIDVDKAYIDQIVAVTHVLFNGDFSANGPFWDKVASAYRNWHKSIQGNAYLNPKPNKEPSHGMPFFIAQMQKSIPTLRMPRNVSNVQFWPAAGDLF